MNRETIHHERAWLYDKIYSFKDYARESEILRAMLNAEGIADGAEVLEAACGTGSHLAHLAAWFRVSGFDKSPEMLAIARTKLPSVTLFEADMSELERPAEVDALLCLFSSIGYVVSEPRLRRTARAFAAALRPGGVLILEPWLTREAYKLGHPTMHTWQDDDLKLCRQAVTRLDGDLSVLEMHWLVARRDHDIEHFVELHELCLHIPEVMGSALVDAGFEIRFEPVGLMPGRGLYIARKTGAAGRP